MLKNFETSMNENTDCKWGRRSFIFYFLILRVKPSSTQSPNFHPDIDLFYDVHFFVTIGVFHTPLLLWPSSMLQAPHIGPPYIIIHIVLFTCIIISRTVPCGHFHKWIECMNNIWQSNGMIFASASRQGD